ncbi:VOC family protein [Thioalkalivibrio sp. HK1]|uniref:VOC family protein n=1 Tax=Thioalkalivibrio sp. HK1 TaxID=1469245 RepID=UPI0004ACAEB9|nr:VOC family protein [Thioalkalivibrio sp. HK1]
MTDTPKAGGVLSADIAFPDAESARRFYAKVLVSGEKPLWREDLMNAHGVPVIGLGALSPEYADLPLQWMPHIQVADVGRSVAAAIESGGSELLHSKSDDGTSQWAVLLDPNGAAFGLIPVVSGQGIEFAGQPSDAGHIAWLDLTVPDADAAVDFYKNVTGWTVEAIEMQDAGGRYADYFLVGGDGNPTAGICHARGVNIDLPPVWLIYLPVGDLTESLNRVEEEGGAIIHSTSGEDGGHTYAVIRDPAGAYLALMPAPARGGRCS